jgi:hypothetical protein
MDHGDTIGLLPIQGVFGASVTDTRQPHLSAVRVTFLAIDGHYRDRRIRAAFRNVRLEDFSSDVAF